MVDDARFWGAVIGLAVVFGNKTIDSAFKVIDRLIDHKFDQWEEEDDQQQS